jgi:hypothetical protein
MFKLKSRALIVNYQLQRKQAVCYEKNTNALLIEVKGNLAASV